MEIAEGSGDGGACGCVGTEEVRIEQRSEGEGSEAGAALLEERAAGETLLEIERRGHGAQLEMVSLRLRRTLEKAVHAASS